MLVTMEVKHKHIYLLRVGKLKCAELIAYPPHLLRRHLPLNIKARPVTVDVFRVACSVENKST